MYKMNKTKLNNIIILFDSKCKLCNFWVNYVIKRDNQKLFKFCSLQSDLAKKILKANKILLDTIYVVCEKKIYTKFYASSFVLYKVNKFFILLFILNYLLPKKLLNFFYDLVGKNRYKLFGSYSECLVPSKNIKDRFLSEL